MEISMDDSSMFMQWAMDTLQHEHQPSAAAAYTGGSGDSFPSLLELHCSALQNSAAPAQMEAQDGQQQGVTNSWSSGDSGGRENTPAAAVVEKDGWSSNPVNCAPSCSADGTSWNFTSALAQPSIGEATPSPVTAPARAHDGRGVPELAYASPPSRKASAQPESAASTSPEPYVQDHVIAERKRREKINRGLIELSSVIPGLKRMDKATILLDAVRYVKEQQEKLKALESVVLVKKPSIAGPDGGGCRSPSAAAPTGSTKTTTSALPEIEARIAESNVMVRIHCEDGKGVLVSLLSEIEGLHLSITHTNVVPFQACTVIITIMAKVDKSFNSTADDIVEKLGSVLHRRRSEK